MVGERQRPRGALQLALLAMNAVAVGIQSSTVQRFGVPGLSSTYLTGTLTTLIIRVSSGHRMRDVAHSAQLLLGLIGGAALAALLVDHAPAAAPLAQLGCLATVLGAAVIAARPG